MTDEGTCKERVAAHLTSRMDDLRQLIEADRNGEESVEDLGSLSEYGLCFGYVPPNTFKDQRRGYFRYQISWGGPSDEFRFFCDERLDVVRIEYWFLDWFDGAKITLRGKDRELMSEWFANLRDCGVVEQEMRKARDE
jgi:hypothetical protein